MTEQRSMDPFERRLADRARAYTDRAAARAVDPLEIARVAMTSTPTGTRGWIGSWADALERRLGGVSVFSRPTSRWGAGIAAVVLVAAIGFVVLGRPFDSGIGPQPTSTTSPSATPLAPTDAPLPAALQRRWVSAQRDSGSDEPGGPSILDLHAGMVEPTTDHNATLMFETGSAAPVTTLLVAGVAAGESDTMVVTTPRESGGCRPGDVGRYRWSLDEERSVLTLTAVGEDACAVRGAILPGAWVPAEVGELGPGRSRPISKAIPEALQYIWLPGNAPPAFTHHAGLDLANAVTIWDVGGDLSGGTALGAVASGGPDTLDITSTFDGICSSGDVGSYRWSLSRDDTILTLTLIADDCAARAAVLPGVRLRSECDEYGCPGLTAGTHETAFFDPFGRPGAYGQLSFTVPDGYEVNHEWYEQFNLLPSDRSSPAIVLYAQPRMSSDFEVIDGACVSHDAPGVGRSVAEIVAAIRARPNLITSPPKAITIGGYDGQMLDVALDPSWTNACPEAPGAPVAAVLRYAGAERGVEASIGPAAGGPFRLILLDLTGGRTMAIVIFAVDEAAAIPPLDDLAAQAMPIIESIDLHPPTP